MSERKIASTEVLSTRAAILRRVSELSEMLGWVKASSQMPFITLLDCDRELAMLQEVAENIVTVVKERRKPFGVSE